MANARWLVSVVLVLGVSPSGSAADKGPQPMRSAAEKAKAGAPPAPSKATETPKAAPVAATQKPADAPKAAPSAAPQKPRAVPFTQVQIRDSFWAKRREINRKATLEHLLDSLGRSGNLRYFDLAAQRDRKGLSGPFTMDAEVYGTLEAIAYSLATDKDEKLERAADTVIAKIAAAQQPDGYLNTYYTVNAPEKRWSNLRDHHELDNLAHLIDAGLAYNQATNKRKLLDVALRAANNLVATFGPGKRAGYPGHPGIESALVRLGRATNDNRFFELARFFLEGRGRKLLAQEQKQPADRYTGVEWQDDLPVRDQQVMKGNMEGAINLMLGAVYVAEQTGDASLLKAATRAWQNAVERRTFLTGGPGSSDRRGQFTVDYDLPSRTGFQGTCAASAMIELSHRLAIAHGDARYLDAMEAALFNVIASSVSADGKRFFQVLPLASTGNYHRSDWFDENCAPVAVARTLTALGGYAYTLADDSLWVNLFLQGTAEITIAGQQVKLEVTTEYPWDGTVKLVVRPATPTKFTLHVRVPAWAAAGATVVAAGSAVKSPPERGFVSMTRTWKNGDQVRMTLPMNVLRLEANPAVKDTRGRMALQRGPIVYCLEAVDSLAAPVAHVAVPTDAALRTEKRADLLGGAMVLKGAGRVDAGEDWNGRLYRVTSAARPVPLTFVPYFAWDNRDSGAMEVWLPTTPQPATAAEARTPIAAPKPGAKPSCPTCKK